jgi:hypothetical protein
MSWEHAATAASIVSSIAVLATLVYLAIQTKQAKSMLLGSSRQAALATDIALLTTVMDHPDAAAKILALDADRVRVQSLLIFFMRAREFQWFQYRSGTLDREAFESYMKPVQGWLGSDTGATYWNAVQQHLDQKFVGFVNAWLTREARTTSQGDSIKRSGLAGPSHQAHDSGREQRSE